MRKSGRGETSPDTRSLPDRPRLHHLSYAVCGLRGCLETGRRGRMSALPCFPTTHSETFPGQQAKGFLFGDAPHPPWPGGNADSLVLCRRGQGNSGGTIQRLPPWAGEAASGFGPSRRSWPSGSGAEWVGSSFSALPPTPKKKTGPWLGRKSGAPNNSDAANWGHHSALRIWLVSSARRRDV